MHIAMFMDFHPATLGGIQTAVRALRRGLSDSGHTVTIFGIAGAIAGENTDDDLFPLATLSGLDVNEFAVVRPGKRNDRLVDDVFAQRGPIDVVHTLTTYGAAITGMRAARRHGLPLVHTAQSRDDAFIEHTAPAPYAVALAMRALHGRFVPHRKPAQTSSGSRAARHAWVTIVGQAQAADHVITPTAHFANLLTEHGLTRPVHIVSNGVDDDLVDGNGTASPPTDGPLRLVWCGRLSAEKRLLEAIDAVERAPNCVLDIYGEGDLHDQAAARSGERIRLHGKVSQAECLTALASADAVLFPSVGAESQGMVLLEATAAGAPVVYCDPTLAETVPDGGGVCTGDLAGTLIALDREALAAMRAVQREYSDAVRQSHQTDAVVAVYLQAIAENAASSELVAPQSISEVPTAPGSLPVFGHALRALRDAPTFVTGLADLGPIVRVHFGAQTGYILTTPDLVRDAGVGAAGDMNRDDLREAIKDIAVGSVNVLRGDEHRLRRRMIAPALKQSRLAVYATQAAGLADTWAANLPAGQRVDLMDDARGLMLDTVSSTLFTADFGADVRREVRENVPWLLSQVLLRTALPPQVRRLRVVANHRFRTKSGQVRAAIGNVIAEYRRRDEDFNDVVSGLIRHVDDETGARLSDDDIIDEAILMLAGGVGSMASLTGWLWHEVIRRPRIAERLYVELDEELAGGPMTPEHFPRLPYLKQVVQETLRFWGPWISAGTASGDMTISGLTIPDGSAIMFSPYMVQHNKRYFANPESFDPDRWSPERVRALNKAANLSFGVGRRRCMGDHFATIEITLAAAALLSRWEPVPDPNYTVRYSNRDFVLSPSALPVTLRARR